MNQIRYNVAENLILNMFEWALPKIRSVFVSKHQLSIFRSNIVYCPPGNQADAMLLCLLCLIIVERSII